MRAASRSGVASPPQISPSSAVYSSGRPRGLLQFPPRDPGCGQSHFRFYGAAKQQFSLVSRQQQREASRLEVFHMGLFAKVQFGEDESAFGRCRSSALQY